MWEIAKVLPAIETECEHEVLFETFVKSQIITIMLRIASVASDAQTHETKQLARLALLDAGDDKADDSISAPPSLAPIAGVCQHPSRHTRRQRERLPQHGSDLQHCPSRVIRRTGNTALLACQMT